ncbi:TnsA endonuclease N-terminal domain-containing protein [Ruegeria hyattellae]|uniref:TnsA endonuclease N-terminal domain-containing protein n=1 Tax=Ruegeria hyattellae TaxID=3233337 RepID=UPI00355AFF67
MKEDTFNGGSDLQPLPSRATRKISKRSKHSSRGGIVAQLPTWERPRIVYFESKLEQRVLFLLLARPDLVDLREQPPMIRYRDEQGQLKHHFFDFLIELRSGRRVAIAVKPAKIARRSRFVRNLRCIRQEMRKDYAHDIVLITDQDFTKAEALNAERYHEFRRNRDLEADKALSHVLASTSFPTTVGKLAQRVGRNGKGYRAVVIAIFEGLLFADKATLIDADTPVFRGDVQ